MAHSSAMTQDGEVMAVLPNGHYTVKLHEMEFDVEAYKGGKMKKHRIKLLPGDWVQVEVNEYDITKGRIIYRYRSNPYANGRKPNMDELPAYARRNAPATNTAAVTKTNQKEKTKQPLTTKRTTARNSKK